MGIPHRQDVSHTTVLLCVLGQVVSPLWASVCPLHPPPPHRPPNQGWITVMPRFTGAHGFGETPFQAGHYPRARATEQGLGLQTPVLT